MPGTIKDINTNDANNALFLVAYEAALVVGYEVFLDHASKGLLEKGS